jgi:hypothetical protein
MNIIATEVAQALSPKTQLFFDMILQDKFWEWAEDNYFNDYIDIIEDIASFNNINEVERAIEILDEFDKILSDNNILNRIALKLKEKELKDRFGYNTIYKLKTFISLMIKKLNMAVDENGRENDKVQ